MKICGLNKTTLLDYPQKVAATVFVGGCNFCCPFCHNGDLVLHSGELQSYTEDEILGFLKKRNNVLEGVCITGGEPTIYPDLPEFIGKVKKLEYLVKLDTNGSNPLMLKRLLEDNLLDYVAMDIKTSLEHYDMVCGKAVDKQAVTESVTILLNSSVEYEFRTTLVKELHGKKDIQKIGEWICGAKQYYLQNYQHTDKNIQTGFHPMEKEELECYRKMLSENIKNVYIRGIE